MGNFQGGGNRGGGFGGGNRGGFGGGKPSFRGGDRGGNRDNVMHKATCSECGKSCEVPFRPSGDKPVYCNECFSSKRTEEERGPRADFGNRGPKREYNDRPSAPRTESKPASSPSNDETKKQLGEISVKLDRLLGAIEKLTAPKMDAPVAKVAVVAPKAVVAKVAPKVEAKKPAVKAIVKKAVAVKAPAKKVVLKKKK